jgi:alpha-glucosidase
MLPTPDHFAWTPIAPIQSWQVSPQGIQFECAGVCLSLRILSANLVRVRCSPTGTLKPRRSWAVALDDSAWSLVPFTVQEQKNEITATTAQLTVHVQCNPCRIWFTDQNGHRFAEDTGLGIGWRSHVTQPGDPILSKVATWKNIAPAEQFYGLGERTGLLNQRGKQLTQWTTDCLNYGVLTDATYHAIPFLLSLQPTLGYGVFLNTTCWSRFDTGSENPDQWRMEACSSELDYYLIYGPQPEQILKTYTQLTGRIPLPPRWAIGYHQSRWSYGSATEVRQLTQEFRQRRIPCDVIHLDIDYMQAYRVFTWNAQRFPDPAALIQELATSGFKVVTIVDPGVKQEPDAGYRVFDEGMTHDYFVRHPNGNVFHGYVWPDRTVFPDFLRPEVRSWWGQLHQAFVEMGVAGIWNDMNEPALSDRPFGDRGEAIAFPLNTPQGPDDERTTHAEAHNLYGLMMAQACREGLAQLRPQERTFTLTRSGYAGIQRWAAVWTGDNHSLWDYLETSLPMLCNLGLSGVPFVGADIGGFAGNATPELFARWMQVGMLYPFMRGHTIQGSVQHEPWAFGDRVEQICRQYIELRYQLLPYLYTLFWEAATTGAPILRPLLYHYPADPHTYELYDQVLLGPSLMAAPVYRPGVEQRMVYLPKGAWYDWWTGDRHDGPIYRLVPAPLERMPLFIRGGGIVPLGPVMQYVDELPLTELRVRVGPGEGQWTLYEDDGHSVDAQTGAWASTTYTVSTAGNHVTMEMQPRRGKWMPESRRVIIEMIGVGEQEFEDDGTAKQYIFPI